MKTISLALFALLSTTQAVKYVPDVQGGWVNPMLNARDDGLDDETVVLQLASYISMGRKHKDAYDHDADTTSPYDGQE